MNREERTTEHSAQKISAMDVPEEDDLEEFEEIGTVKQTQVPELLDWKYIEHIDLSDTDGNDFSDKLEQQLEHFKASLKDGENPATTQE